MGVVFTVDAHAIQGNEICEKFYTRAYPFVKINDPSAHSGPNPTVWCYTPDADPMPLLRKLIRWVTATENASAYILCAERVGSAATSLLAHYPSCCIIPVGSTLFSVPVQGVKRREFLPAPPTDIVHKVYKIVHDPTAVVTTKLANMRINTTQYIFRVRIGRLSVRANSSYKSRILSEKDLEELDDDYMGTRRKLALGDTGASHSLISERTARQLKVFVDTSESGQVILGDNISTVRLLGTCTIEISVGTYKSKMKAYVIDADWGDSQHIVIGADWIAENKAMLGSGDGLGPQLTVGNQTIYAKEKPQPYVSSHQTIKCLSAFKFADLISGIGRKWAALDITEEGVQYEGSERIPLSTYLTSGQYAEYKNNRKISLAAMEATTKALPQETREEPFPRKPPKEGITDSATHTAGGVEVTFLKNLEKEFPSVFQKDLPDRAAGSDPRVHSESIHTINLLPNAKPSFRKAWRTSPAERAEIDKQVAYMLAKGLIQPSSSPWGAPTLFAPKADGSLRMCIDYRGLNAVTERDVYPLPRVNDVYAAIKGKKVFSTLDLMKGYWQIGIQPCDRHLTAFTTPTGLFESKVLTFGLTNVPATFQRYMNKIFGDMVANGDVIVYLDDILVMGEDVRTHNEILREVLSRLSREKLIVRFDKCTFGVEAIKFLGFIIGKEQIEIDQSKIAAITNWPPPTTVTELRGFLGLANYLRKFMPDYATISAPLTAATGSKKKGAPLVMSTQQMEAFNRVKALLTSPPVLAIEDPSKPYEVITDASGLGIGAVLLQRDDNGDPRVIAYESKAFSSKGKAVKAQFDETGNTGHRPEGLDEAALEDASGKQELAALIHALKIWRCNLEGADFTVYVDHNPLVHLLQKKILNRWQVRILDTLATYPGLKIVHIPGKDNIADGLSRINHRIDRVSQMTKETRDNQPAIEAALVKAMSKWPQVEHNDVFTTIPPILPPILSSDTKLLSHTSTMGDCLENIAALFSSQLKIQTDADIGKSRSTRSKTRQMQAPPAAPCVPQPKKPKISKTKETSLEEIKQPSVREVAEEGTIISKPQEDIQTKSSAKTTMKIPEAGNLAMDFLSTCKEGYTKHKDSQDLLAKATAPDWEKQEEMWYYKGALYIPDHYSLRRDCISKYHDSPSQGHPNSRRTYQSVRRFYYWPNMINDINEYVYTCDSCQRHKKSTSLPAGLLQATPIPPANEKGRHWIVDFATKLPLTPSGHNEIMVMKSWDKFTILKECPPGMKAEGAAKLFLQSVSVFGSPLSFRGDRDSRFNTTLFTDVLTEAGCEVHLASVDHHQSVGAAERSIGQIKQILRQFINPSHTNWQELLLPIQHALNNGFCEALGTTPSYYMIGTYPDAPLHDLPPSSTAQQRAAWDKACEQARIVLEKSRMAMTTAANKKRRDIQFKVGDSVLLSTKHPWFQTLEGVKKLIPAWSGPFTVAKIIHETSYVLDLPKDIKTHNQFHSSLLKHYHPGTRIQAPKSPTIINGHKHYYVDEIINHRTRQIGSDTIEEYRVAFIDYGPEYNKWLPEELLQCKRKIEEYHTRRWADIGKRTLAGWYPPFVIKISVEGNRTTSLTLLPSLVRPLLTHKSGITF